MVIYHPMRSESVKNILQLNKQKGIAGPFLGQPRFADQDHQIQKWRPLIVFLRLLPYFSPKVNGTMFLKIPMERWWFQALWKYIVKIDYFPR